MTTTIPFIIHIVAWIVWMATAILSVIIVRRYRRDLQAAREEAEDYRQALAIAVADLKKYRLELASRDAIDRIAAAPGFHTAVDLGREIQKVALCVALDKGGAAIERLTFCPNKL